MPEIPLVTPDSLLPDRGAGDITTADKTGEPEGPALPQSAQPEPTPNIRQQEEPPALAEEQPANIDYRPTAPEDYNLWQRGGQNRIQRARENLDAINGAYSDSAPPDMVVGDLVEPDYSTPKEDDRSVMEKTIWNSIVLWGGDYSTTKKNIFDFISSSDTGKAVDSWYSGRKGSFIKLYADDENDTSPTDENLRVAYAFISRMSGSIEGLHLFGGQDPETIEKDRSAYLWATEVISRADSERGWKHGTGSLTFLDIMEDTPQALSYWIHRIGGGIEGFFSSPLNALSVLLPAGPFSRLLGGIEQAAMKKAGIWAYNMGARTTLPIVAAAVGGRIIGGAGAGFVHQASLDLLLYHPQFSKRLEQLGFESSGALESMLQAGMVGALFGGSIGLLTAPWKRLNAAAKEGLDARAFKDVAGEAIDNCLVDAHNRAGGPIEDANYVSGGSVVDEIRGLLGGTEEEAREFIKSAQVAAEELESTLPKETEAPTIKPAQPPEAREITTRLDEVVSEATAPVELGEGQEDYRGISGILAYERSNGMNNLAPMEMGVFDWVGEEVNIRQKTVDTLDEAERRMEAIDSGKGDRDGGKGGDKGVESKITKKKTKEAKAKAEEELKKKKIKEAKAKAEEELKKKKIKEAKAKAEEELKKAKARAESIERIKKAAVGLDLAMEAYKSIAGRKIKFSEESEGALSRLREGLPISSWGNAETLLYEMKAQAKSVGKTISALANNLKKNIEILKKEKGLFQENQKTLKALDAQIKILERAKTGAERHLELLNWTTEIVDSQIKRAKSPMAPTRVFQEFSKSVNDFFGAIKPPKVVKAIPSNKPLSVRALVKLHQLITKTSEDLHAITADYVTRLGNYQANVAEGKKYGIKPSKDIQRHLDLAQSNTDLAAKIYDEIQQTLKVIFRDAEELRNLNASKNTSPDAVIYYHQKATDLQKKINGVSLKVLHMAQANQGAQRGLNGLGKNPMAHHPNYMTQVFPDGLTPTGNVRLLDRVFTTVPNVSQLLNNIAMNKRGVKLMDKAIKAQKAAGVLTIKEAVDIETIPEFIDMVSTEQGHQEITNRLAIKEQELRNKADNIVESSETSYPYREMRKAVRTLTKISKIIGKIHGYISKKGGVFNLKKSSVGVLQKILDDSYKVKVALGNMDSLDLSGEKLEPETIVYISRLNSLSKYLEELKSTKLSLGVPVTTNIPHKEAIINQLSNYFKDSNQLELADFIGLFTILPPNFLNPSWRYAPSSTTSPIGSFDDFGDIFNAVFMNWLTGLPAHSEKQISAKLKNKRLPVRAVGAAIDFVKNLNAPLRDGPVNTMQRKLDDVFHRESSAVNYYNGILWDGITDIEGAAIFKNTFAPEANLYFYQKLLTGSSKVKLRNANLARGIDKLVKNYSEADSISQETWRRNGVPVQSLGYSYVPQTHDRLRIALVGRDQYVNSILPLLDLDKMKTIVDSPAGIALTPQQITEAQKAWLGSVYDHLTAYGDTNLNYEGGTLGTLFMERELHFKDAESFFKYQNAFGASSGIIQSAVDHLHVNARRQALHSVLGPASGRLVHDLKNYFQERLGEARVRGYYEGDIARILNSLERMSNNIGNLAEPALLYKIVDSVTSLAVDAMLKAVGQYSIFMEPYQLVLARQDLGLSPKGNFFTSIMKGLGGSVESAFYYMRGPFDAFSNFLATGNAKQRDFYNKMAHAGFIFAENAQLVSRTNMTRSAKRFPWSQNLSRNVNKALGTDRMTRYNRHQGAIFFQTELHKLIGRPWDSLSKDFASYLERAGIREKDWGLITKDLGEITNYVKPEIFDSRLAHAIFSPARMSREYGNPSTVGYSPKLADIASKLMVAQHLYVGEGVLQSNPHMTRAVHSKSNDVTDTNQGPSAILMHMINNSLRLFLGWGYTRYRTTANYGNLAKRMALILTGGLIFGMMMMTYRQGVRGKKVDWTSGQSYIKAMAMVGGGNYIDFLITEGLGLFGDDGTINSKTRSLAQKAYPPAVNLVTNTSDAALALMNWKNLPTVDRKTAMKTFTKLHDLFVPDPIQGISNRLLMDNFLMWLDPDAAKKIFQSTIKNTALYSDMEFIRGLKPGDWTSQPLPEELRDKEKYKEEKKKEREKKKEKEKEGGGTPTKTSGKEIKGVKEFTRAKPKNN